MVLPSSFAAYNTHLSIVWILLYVFSSLWWMSDTCGSSSILVFVTQLGFTFPVSYLISCILLAGTTALTHFVLASVALWNGRGGVQEPPHSCSNLWMTMPSLCVDRMGPYCICDYFFMLFKTENSLGFFFLSQVGSLVGWDLAWEHSCHVSVYSSRPSKWLPFNSYRLLPSPSCILFCFAYSFPL